MSELDQLAEHLDDALQGFRDDPADTDYQRGYLAALREVRRVVTEVQEQYER